MTIEDSIAYLRRQFPSILKRVTYDVDKKGRDFCEVLLPNENNENMPITITVNADGCRISAGRMMHVSGEREMSVEDAVCAINDIVNDRIVFVFKYKNEEDFSDRRACDQRFFALTDREDDMSAEFNALIKKIEAPIKNKFQKIFSQNVGIFEFSSFGGKYNKIIKRTSVE